MGPSLRKQMGSEDDFAVQERGSEFALTAHTLKAWQGSKAHACSHMHSGQQQQEDRSQGSRWPGNLDNSVLGSVGDCLQTLGEEQLRRPLSASSA